MTEQFPDRTALRLDPRTRRVDGGRTLLGGAPFRVLRLSDTGAAIVEDLVRGAPIGPAAGRQAVARRLVEADMAHPVIDPDVTAGLSVGVVIPSHDDAAEMARTLGAVAGDDRVTEIVVVDDGTADPATVPAAVARVDGAPVRVLRHDRARGPAAARNTGWAGMGTDLVAFIDAGVTPEEGWLGPLIAHFGDPSVAAAAPRVIGQAQPGSPTSVLDRYEAVQSPLDLGDRPARVSTRGRIRYVPSAALVLRRAALAAVDGFDEDLRFGEDVDCIWRLCGAEFEVRYEPRSLVRHTNRSSWTSLARQRFSYGSSAAALDHRHPGEVAPVEVNAWTLGAYGVALAGGRRGVVAGAAVAVGSAAALVPRLRGRVDRPVSEAVRLGGLGHLLAARWLARAGLRSWLPLLVVVSVLSRRGRLVTGAVAVGVPLADWIERRPRLDPLRFGVARLLDDAAYCAGVWYGCAQHRSGRALVPRLVGIPGLGPLWRRSRNDREMHNNR